ncbi:hypothetical protein PWT90_06033 [Aphanocladium album]|nr:hypothetical protein PWT90_06033 [Aphanocladium album]
MATYENHLNNGNAGASLMKTFLPSIAGDKMEELRQSISTIYGFDAAAIEDIYPCVPMQVSMMSMGSQDFAGHVMHGVMDLHPSASVDRFRAAWEKAYRGSAILRTRIIHDSEYGFLQVVLRENIPWAAAEDAKAYLQDPETSHMELGQSLTRYAWVEGKNGQKSQFIWTAHHAVMDSWTAAILTTQVNRFYNELPCPKPVQFKTYTEHLQQKNIDEAARYWGEMIKDCESVEFPGTLAERDSKAFAQAVNISTELTWQKSGFKRSALVYAAWSLVVGSMTGSDSVVFGTVTSGRRTNLENVKFVTGPTVCTVPAYIEVDWEKPVGTFVAEVGDETSRREKYDFLGLSNIKQINPHTAKACNFGTLVVVQGAELALDVDKNIGEWTVRPEDAQVTLDSLSLEVFIGPKRTKIVANYDTRIIDQATVDMLLSQLSHVMQQLTTSDPTQKLKDINFLTANDAEKIWTLNKTVPQRTESCAHDWVIDQARKQPLAQAISAWDGDFTYAEVDNLSKILAHHLLGRGVGLESIVPLCFEKSKWVSIAILAVLRTGAAFMMIDPAAPQARLHSIVSQAGSTIALSSVSCLTLSSGLVKQAIAISSDFFEARCEKSTGLPRVDPISPMYVVFTSGSTGTPKGVVVSHTAFTTNVSHQADELGFKPKSRVYDFANHVFDDFIYYTVITLVKGGCLCIPLQSERLNNLMGSIIKTKATLLYLTTSVSRLLQPAELPLVETVVVGGEAVTLYDTERWWEYGKLINAYGPAECTTNSLANINPTTAKSATTIGKGMGVLTWIVDPLDHNRLMPVGMAGELLLEGPLLGLGYLNDPAKTASAFIYDPPWLLAGGRSGCLYKTGDLVRYSDNGDLIYVGRKDNQVKINGQRIELEEVEYQVRAHVPLIEQARVDQVVAEVFKPAGNNADPMLAVFLSLPPPPTTDQGDTVIIPQLSVYSLPVEIEDKLARYMPSYMVPAVIFTSPILPMTTTGKIDRKTLREMAGKLSIQELADLRSNAGNQKAKRVPSTPMELALQQLWARVLDIRSASIGLDDSFFRLGGNSITAMKLVSEGHKVHLSLTITDVFRKPTLEAMSQCVVKGRTDATKTPLAQFSLLSASFQADRHIHQIATGCGLSPVQIEDIYPCSPLQEGLFALTSKRQGDFVLRLVLDLADDIDADRFRSSWEQASRDFAVLRTIVTQQSDLGLIQVVHKKPIEWLQGTNLSAYLEQDMQIHMELGKPLARYAIISDARSGRNSFALTLHHAIYDGPSLPRLFNAVSDIYHGVKSAPVEDFKIFVHHVLQASGNESMSYWRSQMDGYQSTAFPTTPPQITQPLANTIIKSQCKLPELAKSEFTIASVARAAWAVAVYSQTGATDVVFGAVVSGRSAPIQGIEDMVGPTIATVPVRICIQPDQPVQQYLEAVQTQMIGMMPFEQTGLQGIAKASPDARQACNIQTLMVMQPQDDAQLTESESSFGQLHIKSDHQQFSTYSVAIRCYVQQDGIKVEADYDARVIGDWEMRNIVDQFIFAVEKLSEGSKTVTVGDVATLNPKDQELLWSWNKTVPAAIESCPHTWIAEQAQANPQGLAISAWDGDLTYAELESLSNVLAHRLLDLRVGFGPASLVPLCFEKSKWVPVAILAVLKAGGAFMMLDPSHPELRLRSIIDQAGAVILLSSVSNLSLCSKLRDLTIAVGDDLIDSKEDSESLSGSSSRPPAKDVDPQSLMYVVFTSGSTGVPKGVMVSHAAFAANIFYQAEKLNITSSSRVYDFTNHIFDMFIHYTITILAKGGCLCIPAESERTGTSDLISSLKRMKPSWIALTPSVARLLDPNDLPFIETIDMGGEAITLHDAKRWWGHVKLINAYGPSECSPTSIINNSAKTAEEVTRIGKGLGAVTWVVDPTDHDKLMPVGTTGELLLEGPLVGLGYLESGAREKTKAAFIRGPKWLQAGTATQSGRTGILYKTGDLVRYMSDGSLLYVGRKDTQVKVNGQRIELGEVEYQTRTHITLAKNADQVIAEVVSLSGGTASPMLAIFLSFQTSSSPDERPAKSENDDDTLEIQAVSADIKNQLAEVLPSYMVPSLIFTSSLLPLTATGKIDRKMLRELAARFSLREIYDQQSRAVDGTAVEKRMPKTHMEEVLQRLWGRVLNIDPASIGLDDSFLQLGGDSITAMQISSTARSLRIKLPAGDILHKKTIGWLSKNLTFTGSSVSNNPSAELVNQGFGLSPIQKLYFQVQPEGRACIDQNCLLELSGIRTNVEQLSDALKTIVNRHSMLRGRFKQNEDGVWEQYISTATESSFVVQHAQHTKSTSTTGAIFKSRASLDIENGPVMAAALVDKGDTQYLFLTIHHLFVDLVSWRTILQELEDILLARELLPEPMLTYQAWLALQNEYVAKKAQAGELVPYNSQQNQLSFWGLEPNIPLSNFTITDQFDLDNGTAECLLGNCNEAYGTRPLELMMAALVHSFSIVFPDREPPAIFNENHGRDTWESDVDLSRTVGWFTSMFPVTVKQSASGNMVSSICTVKDQVRSEPAVGWSKFAAGFENQRAAYNPWSAYPVEVTFNYAGRFQQFERHDSVFRPIPIPKGCKRVPSETAAGRISLFDIAVVVDEDGAHVSFTYSRGIQLRDKVAAWIKQYKTTLLDMANELPEKEAQWTLSDFPLVFQSYEDLKKFQNVTVPALGFTARDVEDVFPCSAMQQGILVSQARDYSRYQSYDLLEVVSSSKVDIGKLEEAWKAVARRHQLLRALVVDTIPGRDGFVHVILKDPIPNLSIVQLAGDSVNLEQIHALYPQAPTETVSLPYHAVICQMETGRVFLYLHMNHAIQDAHSRSIIMDDLRKAYDRELEASDAQYRDVIHYLEAQSMEEAKDYWTTHLASAEPTYFPTLADSSESQQEEDTVEVQQLDASAVYAFCKEWELTPATIIQTAWALVLKHYSGCNAPCFGNISSGRDLPVDGVNEIAGPLICMLPCRVPFADQQTVMETMRSVQSNHAKSLSYQTFPLAQRSDAYEDSSKPQIQFESRDFLDPNEYDLTIHAAFSKKNIRVGIQYRSQCLSSAQAMSLGTCLGTVLRAMIGSPNASIQHLSITPDCQKDQIWCWNREVPSPVDQCAHEWVIQNAKNHPDALAVSAWDGDLTYRELDALSTSLAYWLLEFDIGASSFVPICSEKSKWVSVAIIAVLKTGAAFIMIDPTHPEPRLKAVLAQIRAKTVLCSPTILQLSSRLVKSPIVIEAAASKTQALGAQLPHVESSSPMYAVLTSGSTGVPKVVIISHTAFASGTTYQSEKLRFEPSSRVFDFVNHVFDVFIQYTMATLAKGGCLCIPSETNRSNSLLGSLQETKATHISITPSIARLIDPTQVPSLKTLVLLGEPCTADDTERWWNHVELINAYGPAECTPYSVINNTTDITKAIRIGNGAGMNTWIVDPDDHDKLVPIGMTGELLLEGALLGLGYLGDSKKTKAAFIQNPAWLLAGSRGCSGRSGTLYKTGDLAKYTENGELIYVGRKDTQVKLNGQRVELAEVEHWAQRCIPDAKSVAAEVLSPTGKNAARVLAVFYSLSTETTPGDVSSSDATLVPMSQNTMKALATHLPRYMVPAVFFCMTKLPMTSNGKLNRRQLREIGASFSVAQLSELQAVGNGSKQQPESELGRCIQKVWSQVLATEPSKIGLSDNFFHLGGDSISAMRVVAEARKAGVNISVTTLFRHPTLRDVAKHCSLVADESTDSITPFALLDTALEVSSLLREISAQCNLPTENILDVYPCTPLQKALMSATLQHPGSNILQNTLEISSEINIEDFQAAWKLVYKTMAILRTRFISRDGSGFLQMVVEDDMEWAYATGLDQYLRADRERSMQLGQPLTRYALVKDDAGAVKWFVWTAHHALYDGQTLMLLMNSLRRAFDGQAISPGPQFQAYIKYVKDQTSAQNDDFWRRLLAGYRGGSFPVSPSEVKKAPSYKMIEYQFSRSSKRPLTDITTTVLFRAAWAIVARRFSGSDDVVFGVTVSGRAAPVAEVDRLVAQTTARVPCRTVLTDHLQVFSLLENLQQQATQMIPFEQAGLRHIAQLSSDCEQASKFQTLLVVQPSETREADDAFGKWVIGDQAKWFIAYPLKIDVQLGTTPRIFTTFDTNVLEESKVFQLLRHLESVVYQLEVAEAATTVEQIDLMLPISMVG